MRAAGRCSILQTQARFGGAPLDPPRIPQNPTSGAPSPRTRPAVSAQTSFRRPAAVQDSPSSAPPPGGGAASARLGGHPWRLALPARRDVQLHPPRLRRLRRRHGRHRIRDGLTVVGTLVARGERDGRHESEAPAEEYEQSEQSASTTSTIVVATAARSIVVVRRLRWRRRPRIAWVMDAALLELRLPPLPVGIRGRPGRGGSDNGHFSNVGRGGRDGTRGPRTSTGAPHGNSEARWC